MGLRDIFRPGGKTQAAAVKAATVTQTRNTWDDPLQNTANFSETSILPISFYKSLRREIPMLDLAPIKINRLIGNFNLAAHNESDQWLFDEIMDVNVNGNTVQKGMDIFKYQMFDSAIAYGYGVGETVLTEAQNDIQYLKVSAAEKVAFIKQDGEVVLGRSGLGRDTPYEEPDKIHYLALDTRDGDVRGYSLFFGLPFMTQIFTRMMKSIENTVWRVGDPTFIIQVKTKSEDNVAEANSIATSIANSIKSAMQKRRIGQTYDVTQTMPDDMMLEIGMLGDGKFIDNIEIPMTTVIDQIVGKTGLSHWMLGVRRKGSSLSDNMSEQESDMITTDIKWNQAQFTEIIDRIVFWKQVSTGNVGKGYDIVWDEINLRDEKGQAETKKLNAEAINQAVQALAQMVDLGVILTDEELNFRLEELGMEPVPEIKARIEQARLDRQAERAIKILQPEEVKGQ